MKPRTFMFIAGEPSGDMLAAELIQAIRAELATADLAPTPDFQPLYTSLEPRFFGAGGQCMKAAGVDLAFDMTAHSVIGLSAALKGYFKFKRLFDQLYSLALERLPDAIVCVDFSGFNRRFIHAIKQHVRRRQDWFQRWNPKLIQYVSPQVWASRPGRAQQLAQDYDLLLSILPFEKAWYVKHAPRMRVEFVGHPLLDRFGTRTLGMVSDKHVGAPLVLLLPGSRADELARHLPVMLEALTIIRSAFPRVCARMVLPNEPLLQQARSNGLPNDLEVRVEGLSDSLGEATVAIASTGTVTLECAFFGVPTVALYKTSWFTYEFAKRIVTVKYIAMPNLLANECLFPELLQSAATGQNIARAALELLQNEHRRAAIKARLGQVLASLGQPGATRRAAQAILRLLP
jgi:lipid-A-disaccharide synthase